MSHGELNMDAHASIRAVVYCMQPGITQYVQNQGLVHPTCQVHIIDLLSWVVVETRLSGAGTQLGAVSTVMCCGPAMMTFVHALPLPACSWSWLYTL